MLPFATDFPTKPITHRAAFIDQVFLWLRGIKDSKVLNDPDADLEGESAHLRVASGEELRLREISENGRTIAIGFRHDIPDSTGRIWRTEAVVRSGLLSNGQDLVRLRTQCIAKEHGARLETPFKPHLVKSILRDGNGGVDGLFDVLDAPHWLEDDNSSLDVASQVVVGNASKHLPVVYVSAERSKYWVFNRRKIEQLAFELGGVAHVVVEPSPTFSNKLRDLCRDGKPVYRGTIGIALPRQGFVRRLYRGILFQDPDELWSATIAACVTMRSQMPAEGWDWTELQEQALRLQRQRDQKRVKPEEYLEEIETLQDRVQDLEQQLASRPIADLNEARDSARASDKFLEILGPEIYPGEFVDRLRYAAKIAGSYAQQVGMDDRSLAIFNAVAENFPASRALAELNDELRRAVSDRKRMASELSAVVCRHGYHEKSEKNHMRFEPDEGYIGLKSFTAAKTPSDSRGLKNQLSQVKQVLGITKLG